MSIWKRKRKLLGKSAFGSNEEGGDLWGNEQEIDVDWLTGAKRARGGALEDHKAKSDRLKSEGIIFAENGSYRQALSRFDESLSLVSDQADVLEMKAQVLIELNDDYLAIEAAQQAVQLSPLWWEAKRSLARALLNFGEVKLAVKNFISAVHLSPWEESGREEMFESQSLLLKASITPVNDIKSNPVLMRDRLIV